MPYVHPTNFLADAADAAFAKQTATKSGREKVFDVERAPVYEAETKAGIESDAMRKIREMSWMERRQKFLESNPSPDEVRAWEQANPFQGPAKTVEGSKSQSTLEFAKGA